MYLTLTALIQLNLIATRNPSFWWRFSKKTAPRCSVYFLLSAHWQRHAVFCWHVGGCDSASRTSNERVLSVPKPVGPACCCC